MKLRNNVIGGLRMESKIYRIFPRDRFFELFTERKNALVWPDKWADPYENILLRTLVQNSREEEEKLWFHDNLYCQCWTLHYSSDAMWRIYSPERDAVCTLTNANNFLRSSASSRVYDAVRVRTTVGQLFASIHAENEKFAGDSCFIGKIRKLCHWLVTSPLPADQVGFGLQNGHSQVTVVL